MHIYFEKNSIDWQKSGGLVPVIVQHFKTLQVLMLGYMNKDALDNTTTLEKVTFFSRTKNRLWTKGETSGNFLVPKELHLDCDSDTFLIYAEPIGPVCHEGTVTCFKTDRHGERFKSLYFIQELQDIIKSRKEEQKSKSYIKALFDEGINKIAQKVGEEAVETVIEAASGNKDRLLEESSDLLFHLIVLLHSMDKDFSDIVEILEKRNKKSR
jgi:phosphoribosyl-AMP cyclohydrolase / phosphoribosyl-ATP pyrophosphohydrolase